MYILYILIYDNNMCVYIYTHIPTRIGDTFSVSFLPPLA